MYRGGTDTACGGSGEETGALADGSVTKRELIASSQRILRVQISLGLNNEEG